MSDSSDIELVAAAVQVLTNIPSLDSNVTPGPVGGGCIEHPFFLERKSSIWYESVQELQDNVNGVRCSFLHVLSHLVPLASRLVFTSASF